MSKTYPDLPEWHFEVEEVSAGVFEVTGRDRVGHRVSAKGVDPDTLLEQCRRDALKMVMRVPTESK
jgi:hypothetical protein